MVEDPETKDIWLIDLKMSNKGFYNPENFKHKYLQLVFYYLLIKDKFQALVDLSRLKGAYYYFDDNTWDEIEFSEELVGEGQETIRRLIKEISTAKDFPPRKCHMCSVCGYRGKCEIWN